MFLPLLLEKSIRLYVQERFRRLKALVVRKFLVYSGSEEQNYTLEAVEKGWAPFLEFAQAWSVRRSGAVWNLIVPGYKGVPDPQ